MTTVTHRDLGPDKRAAEMSDSDEAGHANGADLPVARGGSSRWTHGDPVDRRHQHAWVPASAALLTLLIGLSDILAIFRPDLVYRLHKINYLVPGTLTTVTRSADSRAITGLAARIGLLRTMVFSPLPSNVLLLLVPLMPTHWLAVIVLLAVGSDYNLLVVSRFKEEIGAGIKTGIIRAMGATGGALSANLG